MNKEQIIELIGKTLAGGNLVPDGKGAYHPLVIEKYAAIVYPSFLFQVFKNATRYTDYSRLDNFIKTYTVSVTKDTQRDKYYSVLPAQLVYLPEQLGIRQISTIIGENNPFIPTEATASAIFSELEISIVDDSIRYWMEGTKIWYRNMTSDIADVGVLMKLIVNFDEYADTDNVYLPPGGQDSFFNQIVAMIQKRKPEDIRNDNNSKQI